MKELKTYELEVINGGKGWDQVFNGLKGAVQITGGIMMIPSNPASGVSTIGNGIDSWRKMIQG